MYCVGVFICVDIIVECTVHGFFFHFKMEMDTDRDAWVVKIRVRRIGEWMREKKREEERLWSIEHEYCPFNKDLNMDLC